MREKIKQLLGLGIESKVVASAVGISEPDLSALLSDESFAAEVQELKAKNLSDAAQRDLLYGKIESGLLEKLENQIENGMMMGMQPLALGRLLQIINAAKRRATPSEMNAQVAKPSVTLVMPITIAAKFVVNGKNQVTEVEGRTVATMPAAGVAAKLAQMRENQEAQKDQDQLDQEKAAERLEGLVKLSHLPVHELV
jgi:hypothetical protein